MKRILGFITIMIISIVVISCGGGGGTDSNYSSEKITKLNIIANNNAIVKNSGILAQIDYSSSLSGVSSKKASAKISESGELITITTTQGNTVTVEEAVQINSKYIFLKGLSEIVNGEVINTGNYFLDITTGDTIFLTISPENLKYIATSDTHAFYMNSGILYDVEMSTGIASILSDEFRWYDGMAQEYSITSGPESSSLYYVDNYLYVFYVSFIYNSRIVGVADRFSLVDGLWIRDDAYNVTSTLSGAYDCLANILLDNGQWILQNKTTSQLYMLKLKGFTVECYLFDLSNMSETYINTVNIPASVTHGTPIGFYKSFQDNIITNGKSILKFNFNSGLAVSCIDATGVPVIYYAPGDWGVTNWVYLNDKLYIKANNNVYSWDMLSAYNNPDPIANGSGIHFLY